MASQANQKGLELTYEAADGIPDTIRSDATRLRQILINLLSNAIKFTETGEIILSITATPAKTNDMASIDPNGQDKVSTLDLNEQGYTLHFSIADTGLGLKPEQQATLFQPFNQGDASITRRYGGTGLGLAISRRLSELMGGRMWVVSEGIVGRGSIFNFTIVAAGRSDVELAYLRQPQPPMVGKHILLVYTHERLRTTLKTQLVIWGMTVQDTSATAEAVDWLQHSMAFDLVILDHTQFLPEPTNLVQLLRSTGNQQPIPLAVLTPVGGCVDSLKNDPQTSCLTKPLKPHQLYQVVNQLLLGQSTSDNHGSATAENSSASERTHSLRILLAEDNKVNQKVALRALKQLGYQADVVATGLEVLAALDQQSYDVILMDIQMPEMGGMEAAQQIKERFPPHQCPRIVALTANAMLEERQIYLTAGMDDYLSKPFRLETLKNVLQQCQPRTPNPISTDTER